MSDLREATAETVVSAGTLLREERNRQQLSIGDVSRHLKLSIRQIEALEKDEFEQFGGAVFVHGFLRNYAKLLGIGAAPLILAADLTLKPMSQVESQSDIAARRRTTPQKSMLPLFFVMALVISAVVAWVLMHDKQQVPPGDSNQQTSSSLAQHSALGEDAGLPDGTALLEETAALTEPGAEMSVVNDVAPVAANQTVSKPASSVVRLVFDEESWLEVTDRYGVILVSEIVPANASRNVSGQAPLTVVIGNSVGVRLFYNNKAIDLAPHTRADVARVTLE